MTEPAEPGFITVYPCNTTRPTASSLNYTAGQTIANAVVAKTGPDGTVCVYNHSQTHIVADVNGYIP